MWMRAEEISLSLEFSHSIPGLEEYSLGKGRLEEKRKMTLGMVGPIPRFHAAVLPRPLTVSGQLKSLPCALSTGLH